MKENKTNMKSSLSTKKLGRPSVYNKTRINQIFEDLESGMYAKDALKKAGISWSTFRSYLKKDEELNRKYYEARAVGIDYALSTVDEKLEQLILDSKTRKLTLPEIKLLELWVKQKHFSASKISSRLYGTDKDRMAIKTADDTQIIIEWQK